MALTVALRVLPNFAFNSKHKSGSDFKVKSVAGEDSKVGSIIANGASVIDDAKEKMMVLVKEGNGKVGSKVELKKKEKYAISKEVELLYDDGFGSTSVKDYLDIAKEMIKPDGGPPRWFCPVDCGRPLIDAPTLLFLPGMDGVGLGLVLHHKSLGKAFEVRCLHIPVYDRTPFEDLLKLIDETLKLELQSSPNKPIYLVGDSFGGCLALAVAARNPTIDLVIILVNPATSFARSQMQPLFPILEALPEDFQYAVPYLLSTVMGDPLKMAMINIDTTRPPALVLEELSSNLTGLLPRLSGLSDIIPKKTLLWKLKLLKSAASYTNSRLHAVKAEVLVLASGKDNMLPSGDEAKRLSKVLKNCRVRYFKDNGHTLLLEDGINLMTVIKGTCIYRRSRRHDFVSDFVPPSRSEYKAAFQMTSAFRVATSPVLFSTLEDGTIVPGLAGVPSEGPVLLVGYHMLMGLEIFGLVEQFLKEKNVMVRGIAHPALFSGNLENPTTEFSVYDMIKVMGALPVSASNFFKAFSANSHVLLYPGGAREALHYKGEQYRLFWPDQPEFVRMAARFGATIVPFGAVGEDDIAELVLDYHDLMKIPVVNDFIKQNNRDSVILRAGMTGEVANQELFIPGLLPKIPGRFYYLFGKPIPTRGKEEVLKDKKTANDLYLQIKSGVKRNMEYLLKKREEDPYRSIIDRTIYRAVYAPVDEVPTFKP